MFKTYSSSSSLVITSRCFATSRLRAPVSVRLVYYKDKTSVRFHSRKTPHSSPLRASYGVSFVINTKKNDRDISRAHCTSENNISVSQVSLADMKAFAVSEALTHHEAADSLDQTPLLKAHYERIAALPNIAAWLKKRPKTEH